MAEEKDSEYFMSKCCKENYEAILTDRGKLELRCTKCKKTCAILEEKYSIKEELCKF